MIVWISVVCQLQVDSTFLSFLYIIVSLLQQDVDLLEERVTPRKNLPPLLMKLSERKPEKLDYLGVSYGLTSGLLK